MNAGGAQPTSPTGDDDRFQARRGWWRGTAGFTLLLVAAVVVLELWEHPPGWLGGTRRVVVTALHWVRVNWATSAALGVVVSALGVVATLLVYRWQRRAEHQREQRDRARADEAAKAEQARQAKAAEDARRRLLAANCWVDETTGWLPRVGQVTNPIALGVHPAAEIDQAQAEGQEIDLPAGVPVYVPRDKDAELDAKLARGGLVLLVGDSTAGKSRAAYEAIHRLFGQRWLLVPYARSSLRAILDGGIELRETVVWLNDLERWLGADSLDLGLLRRLLGDGRRQVVVVATMRASEYAARASEQGRSDTEREARRIEQELLDQAARVDLARRFSGPERQRATERAWDPRIADALAHAGAYGLAEYIAAGPRLWQRWRDGLAVDNPPERLAGAAIVSAAVDCRRAGFTHPISEQILKDLYLDYLDASVARRLESSAFATGMMWATQPIQATSALLAQEGQGYVAFDYLVDQVQADAAAVPVHDATWLCLLRDVSGNDAFVVGLTALRADRQRFAEQAWRRAAEAGHHDAQAGLGALLVTQRRPDEAEPWLHRAALAGHDDVAALLGVLLHDRGDLDQAEPWLRKAAEAGDHRAQARLGALLAAQDRPEEAEPWLRKAAEASDHNAELLLGALLQDRGDLDQAEPWLRKAAEAGHHRAQAYLGALLAAQDRPEEAEPWLRKAAEAGDDEVAAQAQESLRDLKK